MTSASRLPSYTHTVTARLLLFGSTREQFAALLPAHTARIPVPSCAPPLPPIYLPVIPSRLAAASNMQLRLAQLELSTRILVEEVKCEEEWQRGGI